MKLEEINKTWKFCTNLVGNLLRYDLY